MGAVQFSVKAVRRPREGISRPADHRGNELTSPGMEQEACQIVFRPESAGEMKDDVKDARALFTEWKCVATPKLAKPNFVDKKTRADWPRRSSAVSTWTGTVSAGETPGFSGDPLNLIVLRLSFMFCLL